MNSLSAVKVRKVISTPKCDTVVTVISNISKLSIYFPINYTIYTKLTILR